MEERKTKIKECCEPFLMEFFEHQTLWFLLMEKILSLPSEFYVFQALYTGEIIFFGEK